MRRLCLCSPDKNIKIRRRVEAEELFVLMGLSISYWRSRTKEVRVAFMQSSICYRRHLLDCSRVIKD
jgi:hypothetical protein